MKISKNAKKQYAVLGLGVFGSSVAKTLSLYDCEVLALDVDIKCVNRIADLVTQAMQCDITDLDQLRSTGVADCDVAIVGMGNHLEETVLAIINLKELGVPYIVAKAKNKRYMQIFMTVGADRIVRPEKEMGKQVAKSLLSNNIVEMIDIDSEYSMVEIEAPFSWVGKSLRELDARRRFGINVLGIRRPQDQKLSLAPDADYIIDACDHLVIIADGKTFARLDDLNKI